MAVIAFDTLQFAECLKQAGVPPQQAEAQAAAFAEVLEVNLKELATKEELRLTKEELRLTKEELQRDLKELQMRMDAKMDRLDAKIDKLAAKLAAKLDRMDTRLTGGLTLVKWMLSLLLGGVLALILKAFSPL